MRRLSRGKKIACISATLLFVLMFCHWFGVKAVNTSNLLFAIASDKPGKSAWEALDFIPIVLVFTILVTLLASTLSLMDFADRFRGFADAVVGILGTVSALLVLSQIVAPPIFRVEGTVTDEGAVQLPIVLALVVAGGIAVGGFLSMWEEAHRDGRAIGRGARRPSEAS